MVQFTKGKKSGQIRSNQFLFHCHVRVLRICSTGCSTMISYGWFEALLVDPSRYPRCSCNTFVLIICIYIYSYIYSYIYTHILSYIIRFKRIRTCGCHRSLSTFIQYSRPSKTYRNHMREWPEFENFNTEQLPLVFNITHKETPAAF